MKRLAPKILSIMLSALVLLSASGLNLFIHHCQCEGKIQVSVFTQTGCNHSHSSCEAGSCKVSFIETVKVAGKSCGCWNEVLKVKTDSFTGLQKVESNQPIPNHLALSEYNELNQPIQNLSSVNEPNWGKAPPKPTGKKICIDHHQLKIAHLL